VQKLLKPWNTEQRWDAPIRFFEPSGWAFVYILVGRQTSFNWTGCRTHTNVPFIRNSFPFGRLGPDRFFVRRQVVKTLSEEFPPRELPEPQYRPLFQPSEEDLRKDELALTAKLEETKRYESLKQAEEKLAKFEELRQTWRASSTRASTVELLLRASEMGDGKLYLETGEQVLAAWRAGIIGDSHLRCLAQLLEGHFWLLPDSERTPGVSFRLKEEIAGLRRGSEEEN
jgi:hypothetical protein